MLFHIISNVITIGSNPICDFVLPPTSYYIGEILPVHAQLITESNNYFIIPFSDNIRINEKRIDKSLLQKKIVLNVEDRIWLGELKLFWQQWVAGLGLSCDKCKYYIWRQRDDAWCQFCAEWHHNPGPYKFGYSSKFKYDQSFYNYADCNKCDLKPDWCVECSFFLEPEPKYRLFKEHVDMYLKRIASFDYMYE